MEIEPSRVRQNFLAIVVAAIACFLVQMGWYSYFSAAWVTGIGRTPEWLNHTGVNPALQYGAALLAEAVMAVVISCVTQLTGPQTLFRGIKAALLLWLGFVVPVLAVNYVFEVRTWALFGINIGFWLAGMIVMGAIVGEWKKRA